MASVSSLPLWKNRRRVTESAPYKFPRQLEFVDELPKTVSGKIRRVELRRREESRKGK